MRSIKSYCYNCKRETTHWIAQNENVFYLNNIAFTFGTCEICANKRTIGIKNGENNMDVSKLVSIREEILRLLYEIAFKFKELTKENKTIKTTEELDDVTIRIYEVSNAESSKIFRIDIKIGGKNGSGN